MRFLRLPRFSSLLAVVGVFFFSQTAKAQTRVAPPSPSADALQVQGATLTQGAKEVRLEIDYKGAMTTPPANPFILKSPERWVVDIPGTLNTTTTPTKGGVRVGQTRPGLVRVVAQGKMQLQPGASTPGKLVYVAQVPTPLAPTQKTAPDKAAVLDKNSMLAAGISTAQSLQAEPRATASALRAPTPTTGTTTRTLTAQKLDFEPVAFNNSILLSDQTSLTLESLVARKVAEESVEYTPSPLEQLSLGTQGVEGGELLKPGQLFQTQVFRAYTPSGTVDDDVFVNLTNTYAYGLSDGLQISLGLQGQDNNSPGAFGAYLQERFARQSGNTSNSFQEITLQGKIRLMDEPTFKAAAVLSATSGNRVFSFYETVPGDITATKNNNFLFEQNYGSSLIPVLEVPLTWTDGKNAAFTVSPKLGFLPGDNAGFVAANPLLGGSFGSVGAVSFGGSYKFSERFSARADFTPVLFGNNAVSTSTGLPTQMPVFNAGLRYLVNPRLGLDLYATNSYGNLGLGSLVARDDVGVGVSLSIVPDRVFVVDLAENRKIDKTFDLSVEESRRKAFVRGGFTFLDGGTLPEGQSYFQLKATSNGVLASLRTGSFDDFETGYYVNFTSSTVDESEGGLSTKIRFMNQAAGDPVTMSGVLTLGRTSSRFRNFIFQDRNRLALNEDPFNAGADDRGALIPNLFGLFTERLGETLITTLSFPTQYSGDNFSLWITPKGSVVQRAPEVSLAGVSLGGSLQISPSLELLGEVTALVNGTNAFVGNFRERRLPWNVGLRYSLEGTSSIDLYATNALGLSPYQSMRVIADNGISVGVGLNLPLQLPF